MTEEIQKELDLLRECVILLGERTEQRLQDELDDVGELVVAFREMQDGYVE